MKYHRHGTMPKPSRLPEIECTKRQFRLGMWVFCVAVMALVIGSVVAAAWYFDFI